MRCNTLAATAASRCPIVLLFPISHMPHAGIGVAITQGRIILMRWVFSVGVSCLKCNTTLAAPAATWSDVTCDEQEEITQGRIILMR